MLVAIIVGSLALLLLHLRQSTTGNGSGVFSLRRGWTQFALYSGRGSKTITGQDIAPPRLWGFSDACTGTGKLDMELTGKQTKMFIGRDSCQSALSTIVAPQSITFEISASTPQIQTIKVTAEANTTWYLEIEQAVTQPTLTIGPGWIQSTGMGGDSSGRSQIGTLTKPNGQAIQPKTWAIVFVCIGIGGGHFEFTPAPNSGNISVPPCDGQPRLFIVRYRIPTTVQTFSFFLNGKMVWNAQILGCADEQKCGK